MNRNTVRSTAITAEQRYQHGALTAAEGYAAVLWLAIWLVNAYFTIAVIYRTAKAGGLRLVPTASDSRPI